MTFRAFQALVSIVVLGSSLALSQPVLAQETGPEFSFNGAVTSDYVWRGFSQSDQGPALQGGVDLTYGGFYAGSWASSVDFGDGTDAEWDFYAGFNATTGSVEWDFGAAYYTYVGDPSQSDYDFVEFKLAASQAFGDFTLGGSLNYSPDFYGADKKATYAEINGAYTINDRWTVSGGIGQQWLDVGDDYSSWNLGASVNLTQKLSLDVRYWDADVSSSLSDPRASVTLGVAF